MEGYCKTTGCLREYILRYFGESDPLEGAAGCGNCSNCLTRFEVEDLGREALEVVRFVSTIPGRFGKALVADTLHGSRAEKVRSARLDESSGHGALADMPVGRIKALIDQLVGRGFLCVAPGKFPVLELGPRAAEALCAEDGSFSFTVKRRAHGGGSSRACRAVDLLREESSGDARSRVGDDVELFERLRALRTSCASERGWARTWSSTTRRCARCAAGALPIGRSCSGSRAWARRRRMPSGSSSCPRSRPSRRRTANAASGPVPACSRGSPTPSVGDSTNLAWLRNKTCS